MLENHISLTSRSSDLMRCEGIFVVNTFYSTFYMNLLYNIETFVFTEKTFFEYAIQSLLEAKYDKDGSALCSIVPIRIFDIQIKRVS